MGDSHQRLQQQKALLRILHIHARRPLPLHLRTQYLIGPALSNPLKIILREQRIRRQLQSAPPLNAPMASRAITPPLRQNRANIPRKPKRPHRLRPRNGNHRPSLQTLQNCLHRRDAIGDGSHTGPSQRRIRNPPSDVASNIGLGAIGVRSNGQKLLPRLSPGQRHRGRNRLQLNQLRRTKRRQRQN